ncbi:MAG: hypothetical protein M2R45_03968 [Verrucomicrobia subdivision 3 bacterium]|nr:hypothetical protein [Limisphaerales bacterium]MCS1415512.1 hypothetical protein [Limisphaerales bacterium]
MIFNWRERSRRHRVCTMYDGLNWGGEAQALIFDSRSNKVRDINALGVAPTGATPEFFLDQGLNYPPGTGPLADMTPGTSGGLIVMLAEFGSMSLSHVLELVMGLVSHRGWDRQPSQTRQADAEAVALLKTRFSPPKELFGSHRLQHYGNNRPESTTKHRLSSSHHRDCPLWSPFNVTLRAKLLHSIAQEAAQSRAEQRYVNASTPIDRNVPTPSKPSPPFPSRK